MVARNGIADATLAPVPGEPGARLRFDAAASWERVCDDVERRYGWRPSLTSAGDAFRSYEIQERIFRQRYTPAGPTSIDRVGKAWDGNGNGVPEAWFRLPIWAAAATPGTSNHGWGLACDVTGLGGFTGKRYREFATVAAEHGWDNVEGRSIAEAWHWRYRPENDRHRGTTASNPIPGGASGHIPTPNGDLPDPLEEDVVTAQDKLEIATLVWAFQRKAGGPDMAAEMASLATVLGSTYQAVLGADAGEVARDAEDDTERRALWDQVVSTRADVQRADEITRAQLNALSTALDALAASKGVDPAAIRSDVQAALAGLTATVTLTTPNGA